MLLSWCRTRGGTETRARLLTLAAVCGLAIAFGTVRASSPDVAPEAVVEEGDYAGPQSLSVGSPIAPPQFAVNPNAPTAGNCSGPVVTFDNSNSVTGRAPVARYAAARGHYLILQSELAAAGIAGTTTISGIGWRYDTAPGLAATAPLKVYLENALATESADSKSATWATAISTMTLVHNASTTLPNAATGFDIAFSGGTFAYTGGALYVAYDWGPYAGTLSTAATVSCNSTGVVNRERQANSAAVTLGPLSNFGPETRLTAAVANNDASVVYVISLGSLAQPLVGLQTVQAVVTNKGSNALTNLPVTFDLTGAETFTNTQNVASLAACGGQSTVTFAPFTPSAIGGDTVTISVPPDDVPGNSVKSKPLNETFNLYSYKHPGTTASGGVGVTASTADLVAKFTTTVGAKISAINLEFPAVNATTYRVAVYPDSGSGTPGLVPLYQDAADRTIAAPGPVTITLPSPVAVGPGAFFAGIQQTNTTNAGLSFDTEVPVRSGSFYLAVPHPAAAWVDFAPGNNFKLNVGVTLVQCASGADCNDNNACTDDACTNSLCVHTNNGSTSCDGNSCSNPDQCLNGTCIPGPNPCNDNNVCTIDLCDGHGGCLYNPFDCNDNNPCTDDSCIPGSGCAHANNTGACSDGNPCTIGDVCAGGVCQPGAGALPAAVQFCNGAGIAILDAVAPTIASPYPSPINVVTPGSYVCSVTVNLNGITHAFPDDIDILLQHLAGPSAIIMSDVGASSGATGVNLTLSDAAAAPLGSTLVSGTFQPTNTDGGGTESWPAPAPAPPAAPGSALSTFIGRNPNGPWNLWVVDDFAADAGTMSGWCVTIVSVCAVSADCNDGNPCTDDGCTNATCTHTNNTSACNDGNACTASDVCSGGVCVGGASPACDDGNACTANTCNPATGQCEHPTIVCNDGNTCTDDSCSPATGCVFTANDNNTCTDNSLCTAPDVCQSGVCVGQDPVICAPDANLCTTEACDPATGNCVSTNNTNACDDGNACTTGDICGPTFAENFDAQIAPSLPGTWSTSVTGTGAPWSSVNTSSDTPPNSAFGPDGPAVADAVVISPSIAIATPTAMLTFKNRWSFEPGAGCFDGGVLEISIAGGTFTDIVTAGGTFLDGGYSGTVSGGFGNPLAARSAWCNASVGYPAYLQTVVVLPAAAAGRSVRLRWRVGSDQTNGGLGQNIDSIALVDGGNICKPGVGQSCEDGNPCTNDSCDVVTGCHHTNNTATCDDGNACTNLDTCAGGACAGTTIVCNDSNPCTIDTCNPGSGCNFAPITAPPEVQNVAAAADKTTYSWSAAAFATRYDVVRGGTSALPVGPGGGDEVCFDNLAGTTLVDATVPGPGTGFWYLSRGENACGNGTYGAEGVNGAAGAPRITSTCP